MYLFGSLKIEIAIDGVTIPELRKEIIKVASEKVAFSDIDLLYSTPRLRGLDPNVLVAAVAACGTALDSLISAIISIVRQRDEKQIIIKGREGETIEISADTPIEKLDELIERVRKLDHPRIEI